jgi:hypothetical protein
MSTKAQLHLLIPHLSEAIDILVSNDFVAGGVEA